MPSLSAKGDPRDGTRGSRRWLVWGGAAAIVVLGAWQLGGAGLFSRDGAGGAGGEPPTVDGAAGDPAITSPDGAADGTTAVATADIDPGEPTSPLQDASLVIQSFPNAAEAQEFADRLSENLGELLFTVVPSSVNGQTWYRTMAGPARDISEIPGIQERIQQANLSMLAGRTGWFPRRTGLAFLLTEERTLAEADALARRYRGEGIPAYVMAVDYSAGVRLYRVYAGGYAGEDESAPLARLLSDAGVDAELVPRLGSMPSDR
ncbi:MAG: SPOR domain-containing protein [Gemmatimonadetes bacterium]|nr:SPOR domain-containing protein [Gemmatimonadota bacterium]